MTPITVSVPGTCGELVQGWHPEWDEPVLVSCSIDRYTNINLQPNKSGQITFPNPPHDWDKLQQAAQLTLTYLGHSDVGATIEVESQLRRGCGMASSTADVVGIMQGLAQVLGHSLSPKELAQLACQIEPSDSTMFPNATALAYRGSAQFTELGPLLPLPLLMLDPGSQVETVSYNASLNLTDLRALSASTAEALHLLQAGLNKADAKLIGAAATVSALSYQKISYSALVKQAKMWANETNAVGLVRAHSGSVVGLLYPLGTELTNPAQWLGEKFEGRLTQTQLANPSKPETILQKLEKFYKFW